MTYDAAGFRSYREIRALLGNPIPKHSGPAHKDTRKHRPARPRKSKGRVDHFKELQFLAWDGEGITDEGQTRNRYVMLSNSKRECLRGHDLQSEEIFDFLLERRGDRNTIHCVYGAVYDFTHWFLSIPDELKRQLHEMGEVEWCPREGKRYFIQYMPRKSFRLEDRSQWVERKRGEKWRLWRYRNRKNVKAMIVWDVIGFFQQSFVSTLKKWQVTTDEEIQFIANMKGQRRHFDTSQESEMLEYNFRECELLQSVMEQLHRLLLTNPMEPEPDETKVWLPLKRWDGAGAIAAAMYRREGVKEHVGSSTELGYHDKPAEDWHYRDKHEQAEIEYALRCAYFGGRIECFQRGRANAPGYDLDVKSAYPAAMLTLPSFAKGGRWYWHHSFRPDFFGVWQIEWDCKLHEIYPFPYRLHTGGVVFPREGAGWYHTVEVETAMQDERNRIKCKGGWVWIPASNYKPFGFVQRYFDARVLLQQMGHAAEKVIKLGLNSLYGKMAQTLGSVLEDWVCKLDLPDTQHRTDDYVADCDLNKIFKRAAGFYNLAWAGAVTAHCRSTVYAEAIKRESEIVMIQTDGLFGTGPTPDIAQENKLGGFEISEYDDSIVVQAGVYYLATWKDGVLDWGTTKKTRGFAATDVGVEEILDGWEKGNVLQLEYKSSPRFQTLGYSINKRDFSTLACWQEQGREMNLYMDTKRTSIKGLNRPRDFDPKKAKGLRLNERQLPTFNLPNWDFQAGCPSRPCNPKWKEKLHSEGEDDIALTESEIEGEDYLDNFAAEIREKFGF